MKHGKTLIWKSDSKSSTTVYLTIVPEKKKQENFFKNEIPKSVSTFFPCPNFLKDVSKQLTGKSIIYIIFAQYTF